MPYLAIRHLHITFAALSIGLFVLRAGFTLAKRDWRAWRLLRWLPHLNDTLLLMAAITLATLSHQYPLQANWLTAKVLALLAYIGLGRQALKSDLPSKHRLPYLAGALLSVSYIVAVAMTRRPFPFG